MTNFLKPHEIDWLQNRFNLEINLENGTVVARRKDGKLLKKETVRKMVGREECGLYWREENGAVKGL